MTNQQTVYIVDGFGDHPIGTNAPHLTHTRKLEIAIKTAKHIAKNFGENTSVKIDERTVASFFGLNAPSMWGRWSK